MSEIIPASFRDPSGFLFRSGGKLFRQVNESYKADFDALMGSGLYDALVKKGLLVSHKEAALTLSPFKKTAYKIIQPELIGFISYPYEWSFGQLKEAALTTLKIQKLALKHGMTLKDASAYNIQFHQGQPVLIDTLSFEVYEEGEPWVAYKQFCQHFLAPLALMSYTDVRLSQLMRVYIDGVPLDLASRLLPIKTKFKPFLSAHIHLHAKSQAKYSDSQGEVKKPSLSKRSLEGIITSLESVTMSLKWQPPGTEWGDYYEATNYSSVAFKEKHKLIEKYLKKIKPKSVWDLGANNGLFSRIASNKGIPTVAFDIDPVAVEKNYLQMKAAKETSMLPLVMDLTNPSPALGWGHEERDSLEQRGRADLSIALALIHHLAISNNVPLERIAEYFAKLSKNLVIEFVPKTDSQVKKLLSTREDVFPNYTEAGFEDSFKKFYKIITKDPIKGSERALYLMERK